MNFQPSNGDWPDGPYDKHPLVLAVRAETDRMEKVHAAFVRSLRINIFIAICIGISVAVNLALYLPTTIHMLASLWRSL